MKLKDFLLVFCEDTFFTFSCFSCFVLVFVFVFVFFIFDHNFIVPVAIGKILYGNSIFSHVSTSPDKMIQFQFFFYFLIGAEGNASADVDHHLEMGKRLLAAGQLTEALSHYHSAIGIALVYHNFNYFYILQSLHIQCVWVVIVEFFTFFSSIFDLL